MGASQPQPVRGEPGLIMTKSQSTASYDVVVPCRESGVGVLGKGSVRQPRPEDVGATAFNNWTRALTERLEARIGKLAVGVGWGLGCDGRSVGPRVYVPHFRNVDPVVAELTAYFASEDLGVTAVVVLVPDRR